MGLCNCLDIFQTKMDEIFHDFEFLRAYIDDLLIITKGDWSDHWNKLELVVKHLKENRLKCNIEKLFFGQTEMECMVLWVTRNGIRPVNKKVEAIVNMTPPKNVKHVRAFIGLVKYYRDMWAKRSHLLQPLTELMSIR